MKIKILSPLTLAVSTLLLGACATTGQHTPNNQIAPKNAVASAIKSQLHSSFSYQTQIISSNAIKQDTLKNHQLKDATLPDPASDMFCEDTHDQAYVALGKLAKQQEKTLDDDSYEQQRKQLQEDYLACQKTQKQQYNDYQPFDLSKFYEENKALDNQAKEAAFIEQTQWHLNEHMPNQEADNSAPTTQDAKIAELLQVYLFKPTHLEIVGRYEPLKGKITALPTLSYDAKNLSATVSQPIYIDLHAKGIYLWADNFALANSQVLDKELGDKWHNKWLFIPLNDGSLPEDFAVNLLDAYVEAKKESFAVLDKDTFKQISAQQVEAPFIKIPQNFQSLISTTPTIIRYQASHRDKAYSDYIFMDTLYNHLTDRYPQLMDFSSKTDRTISEGQSVIEVIDVDNHNQSASEPTFKINSKFLTQALLVYLKTSIDDYTNSISQEQTHTYTPITHYGINDGKLSWLHQRSYLPSNLLTGTDDAPIFVDSFTQIHQNSKNMGEFNRLPSALQTPNASNSINVFTYGNELFERVKNGQDKYLQTLSRLLIGAETEMQAPDEGPTQEPNP